MQTSPAITSAKRKLSDDDVVNELGDLIDSETPPSVQRVCASYHSLNMH